LPGGSRNFNFEYVWIKGRPPRYLKAFALLFLIFAVLWGVDFYILIHSAVAVRDSLHSVAQMGEKGTLYYPWPEYWFAYAGVYVVLGWIFALGVIMAFHRKRQWKKNL